MINSAVQPEVLDAIAERIRGSELLVVDFAMAEKLWPHPAWNDESAPTQKQLIEMFERQYGVLSRRDVLTENLVFSQS